MSTPRIVPLAVARIFTSPPPEDAFDLDAFEVFRGPLQLGLRVLRHFHELVQV